MDEMQADTVISEITDNPYMDPALYEAAMTFSAQIGMPQKGIELGISLAKSEQAKGNLEEAIKMYGTMLMLSPDNVQAMIGMTECLLDEDMPEQAFLLSSAIILSDRSRPDGHKLSAKANTMMGRFDEAEADLKILIEIAQQKGDGRLELIAEKLMRENRKIEEMTLAEASEVEETDSES
jgi:tetratricopeptide (TPR) repeat protein